MRLQLPVVYCAVESCGTQLVTHWFRNDAGRYVCLWDSPQGSVPVVNTLHGVIDDAAVADLIAPDMQGARPVPPAPTGLNLPETTPGASPSPTRTNTHDPRGK